MVLIDEAPHLVVAGQLLAWSPGGYTTRRPVPAEEMASAITPPSLLALLRSGWAPLVPMFHPSAKG